MCGRLSRQVGEDRGPLRRNARTRKQMLTSALSCGGIGRAVRSAPRPPSPAPPSLPHLNRRRCSSASSPPSIRGAITRRRSSSRSGGSPRAASISSAVSSSACAPRPLAPDSWELSLGSRNRGIARPGGSCGSCACGPRAARSRSHDSRGSPGGPGGGGERGEGGAGPSAARRWGWLAAESSTS